MTTRPEDESRTRAALDLVRSVARRTVRALAMATADVRPAPDVVIIGVKRGGTTSVFRDLETHPAMLPLVPSARRLPLRENQKGVHYFDTSFDRGERWYRSHFAARPARWFRRRRVGSAFTAEASPYYFFQPSAAERAAAALPETLFVVVLRDPVERTVSHWAEQTRNGVETLPLADAVDAEPERLGDDADRLASGTIATSHAHEQQSFAAQSEYADSLERWFAAVGRDRVHVVFSEDYYRDPETVLNGIVGRLGLDPFPAGVGAHRNAAPRPGRLDPELEKRLVDRFAPDVERVATLVGSTPPWPRFASESSALGEPPTSEVDATDR